MSAAILQGVPATTLDTDLWIDLPPRQYMRTLNLCRGLGATVRANTVVDLTDGSAINFLPQPRTRKHNTGSLWTTTVGFCARAAGLISAGEELSDFFYGPLRGGQPDPLRSLPDECIEPGERE